MTKKLNELTIEECIIGYKNLDFAPSDVLEACLDAIDKHDSKIKAFITVLPKHRTELIKGGLLEQAKYADEHIAAVGPEQAFKEFPLLGIPYACKDNFNTKNVRTTASSKILDNYISPYESTVTQRLQEAGAILIGKTNMDAFAHGSSTETSDYFTTKNPWNLNKLPGGSSGGSTAAVAANMCIFAIGSETAGSIRGPAAWCGVTGLKPTYGRVSRYGVIAMASSTDSPGPITKTVWDAAYILNVIAGEDPLDATSSRLDVTDYNVDLEKPLAGIKIGKPKSYFEIDLEPGVLQATEEALAQYEKLGAEIVDLDLIDPKYSIAVYTVVQRSEVSSNLARFDGIRYGNDRTRFGFEAKKRMMLGAYALSSGYYDEYYAKAQKVRTLLINDFNTAFEKVDLLIAPTMPNVAPDLGASEKSALFGELVDLLHEPSSVAGLAAISIPCGFAESLPVGLQLIGPQFSEKLILNAAHQYQKATNHHTKFPKEDLWV